MRRAICLCVLGLVACGQEPASEPVMLGEQMPGPMNPGPGEPMTPTPSPAARAVLDGLQAPELAISLGEGAVDLATQAVWLASASGVATTTGTLRQQGGQNAFMYEATPADRLVIDWSEGEDTTIRVLVMNGDFESDAEAFLKSDHELRVQVSRPGTLDMTLESVLGGQSRAARVQGTVTQEGVTYSVDLTKSADIVSDIGFGSVDYESTDTITGSIKAPELDMNVQETRLFKFVRVDTGVANVTRTANNTWTSQGESYALRDLVLRFEEVDGWPSYSDFWTADGAILENGVPVGALAFNLSSPLWISLELTIDGESHELQRWLLKQ